MVTIASMTSTPEELEHAAGPNWREPFVPKAAPTVEEPATEEVKTEAESEPAEPESKEPKHKGGWQKRIDKLTARHNAAETRAEKAERELSELRAKYETPAQEDQPPQLKDYKTPEEWADARDAWKAAQAEKQEQAEETKKTFESYQRATEAARAKHEDWEEVVSNPDIQLPITVYNAIIELGKEGPEVAYYLGQHPEFCEELMSMKPLAAVVRIGKIADALKGSSPEKKEKAKPKPPEPIATVGASSARSAVPLDQLDPKEYIKVMNKRERERRF
jgi:hypothetical protein